MPPRRSSRAASAKPPSKTTVTVTQKTVTKVTPAPRSRAKRAVSPERTPSPPPKRARNGTVAKAEVLKPAANGRAPSLPPAKKLPHKTARKPSGMSLSPVPEAVMQQVPYFNPLPVPPEHARPSPQLFVWGAGNFGQFGMGTDSLGEYDKPKRNLWIEGKIQVGVFGGEGAGLEAVAAGGLHTLFIDEKGTVWSCGVNDDAALGRITQNVPDPKSPGSSIDIDELTAVPHPLETLTAEGFRAVKITAGDSISAAISSEGELRVWGSFRGTEGILGFASGQKHQFLPTPILHLEHKHGNVEKAVSFASGNNHLLVLTTHGNVFAWGSGDNGQLGHKILERRKISSTVPYKITLGSRSRKAVVVGAGNYHSFAVDEAGDVWGWGLNSLGQTGTGLSAAYNIDAEVQLPRKVIGLSKDALSGDTVIQIVGGEHHTLFLTSGGKVYACGRADNNQLGLSFDHPAFQERTDCVTEPTLVKFPDADDPIVQISAGTHNSMAVSKGGALYAWGRGEQGELGLSGDMETETPTVVVRREGGSWSAVGVSCGGQHTLGLFRKKT